MIRKGPAGLLPCRARNQREGVWGAVTKQKHLKQARTRTHTPVCETRSRNIAEGIDPR